MAIQNRRGNYTDFDPTKMVAGEFAIVQSGDEHTDDGKALYIAPTTGSVERIPFAKELEGLVEVDDTLTEAGAAADAKKTGDEITALKDDLSEITEITGTEVSRDTFVNLTGYYIGGAEPHNIAMSANVSMMYVPCEPNTEYKVDKIQSKRFQVAYTTELPANGVLAYEWVRNDSATSITITTGNNALYLCVYYKHSSDTLTENEIYNSIRISYGMENTAVDKIARNEIETIHPGLSEEAKTALLNCFEHVAWIDDDGWNYYRALKLSIGRSNRRPELPDTFEQVTYIKSTGTQYIILNDVLSQVPFRAKVKASFQASGKLLVSAAKPNGSSFYTDSRFFITCFVNNKIGARVGNNSWIEIQASSAPQVDVTYDFETSLNYGNDNAVIVNVKYDDGEKSSTMEASTLGNILGNPIQVFRNAGDGVRASATLHEIVLYSGNTKLFDGIPCYRKSDSVGGLYDAVSESFYASQGTTDFEVGQIVV